MFPGAFVPSGRTMLKPIESNGCPSTTHCGMPCSSTPMRGTRSLNAAGACASQKPGGGE